MLKRITTFFVGVVVGGIMATVALKYHIVRAADGHYWIPKTEARFSEAYVDIRDFGLDEWQDHPGLAMAITRSGNQELVNEATRQSVRQTINDWLD